MQLIKTVSCLLAGALALTFVSCEKEDKTISVEKIAFNETSLTLSVGQTLTPELTITPDDATDKTYILASSDEAVVTVSGSEIKAVAAGDAVITATVQGGTLTSECSVTVVPEGYPTELTAFNSAKGFFYGDYYMAGTDNSWTYFTSGSVVFADGAFSGKGTALFLELNAPKSGDKSVRPARIPLMNLEKCLNILLPKERISAQKAFRGHLSMIARLKETIWLSAKERFQSRQ